MGLNSDKTSKVFCINFIKVEYQQNSDIINDVIDYVLCCVLYNELFIKILLLLVLWVIHHMKILCAFKRYVTDFGYKANVAKFHRKMS